MKTTFEALFKNREIVIATKHHKEKVIAPLFEKEFSAICFTPNSFDTDRFGSLTGEIQRKKSPLETLTITCVEAMTLTNCEIGIASEGSFGPHPFIPFTYADDEFMILIDKRNELEIVEREISIQTNFNSATIKSLIELNEFAAHAKFPSHGLILQASKSDFTDIKKGIIDWETLQTYFNFLIHKYGEAYVQTDMRAMYNPTRMEVIEKLTNKLIHKIKSICPQCETPGFGITNSIKGLPCKLCGQQTQSILSLVYTCARCSYHKEVKYPHHKMFEDPMFCDFCNP